MRYAGNPAGCAISPGFGAAGSGLWLNRAGLAGYFSEETLTHPQPAVGHDHAPASRDIFPFALLEQHAAVIGPRGNVHISDRTRRRVWPRRCCSYCEEFFSMPEV